ncbi:MAG: FAD-dependent oxidoreductase [Chloroflexota bacterium]
MYDLIIVGAGPAGMTAAVYAARKKLNTLLVTKDVGGQVNWTLGVENYMGYQFIEGQELMTKFEEQVKKFPIDIKIGQTAGRVSRGKDGLRIETESGTYEGRAIVVASGKRPRPLNVPGEERLRGRGVTYCSVCDGPVFTGRKVAVVGGGNSALEAVNDLVKIAERVFMVSLTPLTGDAVLIEKAQEAANLTVFTEYQVLDISGDNMVDGVRIRHLKSGEVKSLEVAGIFIEIGLIPNSELVKGLAELNDIGEVKVNCSCETSVPGLFAAGDVTDAPEKQIVVAAGEGAKAALRAHRYLQRLKS